MFVETLSLMFCHLLHFWTKYEVVSVDTESRIATYFCKRCKEYRYLRG